MQKKKKKKMPKTPRETNFTIDGKPHAKGRYRFRRDGRTYPDPKTKDFELVVATAYRQKAIGIPPWGGRIWLDIGFYFEIPKSWSKKKKASMLYRQHCQRPDLDNLSKTIKDALSGDIAWEDDCQVCSLNVFKGWREASCTIVRIVRPDID